VALRCRRDRVPLDRPGVRGEAGAGQPRLHGVHRSGRRAGGGFKETAARFDTPALPREAVALSLAAIELLEAAGWEEVQARAVAQARRLADALRERGRTVMPRGATTLVSWEDPYAEDTRDRLAAAGIVVRNLPGRALLRASVGAWNDERDLERLLNAI